MANLLPTEDSVELSIDEGYKRYRFHTRNARVYSIRKAIEIRARGANKVDVGLWVRYIVNIRTECLAIASAGGADLVAYARQQTRQPTLDFSQLHQDFIAALDAAADWIIANEKPLSLTNDVYTLGGTAPNYTFSYNMLTPAQLEDFALLLDSLAALLEPVKKET